MERDGSGKLIGAIDNGKALLLFHISESTNLPNLTLPGSSGEGVGVFLNDRPTQRRRPPTGSSVRRPWESAALS